MASFQDIISEKKHAEAGDVARINKLGGLKINFSGQRFTQGYLDSFMVHIEASKVIENAQRDINIAFINEVAKICTKINISSYDVLEASLTKWNFLNFEPGLVGGHCIGVDPYYLAEKAKNLNGFQT